MSKVGLLFSDCKGLSDLKTRASVLRIPQVSNRLREAQSLLDWGPWEDSKTDFFSFLLSDDRKFNEKRLLKKLIVSVVQLGLFDRYIKYYGSPDFMIGPLRGTSALEICAGVHSFEEMVFEAEYSLGLNKIPTLVDWEQKELEHYQVYRLDRDSRYRKHSCRGEEVLDILEELQLNGFINECVFIGFGDEFSSEMLRQKEEVLISSISSIELDPLLNSFWEFA